MHTFLKLSLASLLMFYALPASAAEVVVTTSPAIATKEFTVSVVVNLGTEQVNVLDGSLIIPDGITVDTISTAGSELQLFTKTPSYSLTDHAVTFAGGVPKPLTGDTHFLFSFTAHAENPGTYSILTNELFAYRADGKGTRVTIPSQAVTINVATADTNFKKEAIGIRREASSALSADIGKDVSLFGGKTFVTFYGGDDGTGIDHYEVQEGWWQRATRVQQFYVLHNQQQGSTVRVYAIDRSGHVAVFTIPGTQLVFENLIRSAVLLALLVCSVLIVRWNVRKQ